MIRASLTDIATKFPILPGRLADAIDTYGPDAQAFYVIDGGHLLLLEVVPV